jgi:NADPH-dependent ferric siderophore reductase
VSREVQQAGSHPGNRFSRHANGGRAPAAVERPRRSSRSASDSIAHVTDVVPLEVRTQLDDPFAELTGALAGTRRLRFEVVASDQMSPSMQRIVLTAPELDGFEYHPGQDVMLLVAAEGARPIRRRYTIRSLDRDRLLLTLNVVLHGSGPGERWVCGARPGDTIEGIGPRGKIRTSPEADWHLFMGDESAMTAILTMTESLPGDANATLVIEVPDPADEQELLAPARTRVSWLHRFGGKAGDPQLLTADAAQVELPVGDGHAYLFGEAKVVFALREILSERGMRQDQMAPKAYWGRGRANAGHGEPAKDA